MKTNSLLVCTLALFCGAAHALPTIAPAGIDCGNGLSCAAGQTCFSNATGAGELLACSPFSNAVFCHDARFSCPAASTCSDAGSQVSVCLASDGSVIADATMNVDAIAAAEFRDFGHGMVEVKNAICGPLTNRIPATCRCAGSGRIGATVTCAVGIPLSGGLTIGAEAHFHPCAAPASWGFRGFIGGRTLIERRWDGQFRLNLPAFPAPPAGFRIGVASVTTRAEISGVVNRGVIQATLSIGACGSVAFAGCCNTACPFMSRAPLPVPVISGTYDFSRLC